MDCLFSNTEYLMAGSSCPVNPSYDGFAVEWDILEEIAIRASVKKGRSSINNGGSVLLKKFILFCSTILCVMCFI
jgi:hypothetical protein